MRRQCCQGIRQSVGRHDRAGAAVQQPVQPHGKAVAVFGDDGAAPRAGGAHLPGHRFHVGREGAE
jgi:hypothetical protein